MIRALFLFIILSGLGINGHSQTISGKVLDNKTHLPLIGAHIYIINSLQGVVSDADGKFLLTPPNSYGELLITYVGYTEQKVEFTPETKNIVIYLVPNTNQLDEVSVKSTEDKKWKRLYKKFEKAFFGDTYNAGLCHIENPWVVDISKGPNGEILAKSIKPIEIINNALGYKLTFYLYDFTLKGNRLHYRGDLYFKELKPKLATDKSNWTRKRAETFLGSKRHFITALNNKKLGEEGFELYSASLIPEIGFTTNKRLKESNLLKVEHTLSIPDYLKIVYTKAPPQRGYLSNNQSQSINFQGPKADLVPKGNLHVSTQSTNEQVSYLFSRNSKLMFMDTGYIVNSTHIIEYGYWSWLGVAEMMPYEYDYIPIID